MEDIDQRAIVVGASSGMGNEVARILLNDGWTVGVAARRLEPLEVLAKDYPGRVFVRQIDITDDDAATELRGLIYEMGGMDLYFHSSGVGWQNPELDADKELQTVKTNGLGFARMVGEAYRFFAEKGSGHIAVISSIAGTKGLGPAPSYSATKAFDNVYIQALEQLAHMHHLNIHFTDIRPGFVRTALLDDGHHYPLMLDPVKVAHKIVKAIYNHRHVVVIDWRWRVITALWRRIPRWLWRM